MPSGCSDPKGAKKDVKKNPPEKNKEKEKKCPLVKLVELVEVVTEGKGEVPVTGVADAPKDGVPVPWKSELAKLKRPTNPERQYINLPRKFRGFGHGGAPHHGRYIEFRARIKPKGTASGSLAGKTVHFSFTPTYGTGRPAQIYDGAKEGFGTQTKTTAQTDANGWTSVVKFKLSMYGEDKFKIAAQADENGKGKLGAKLTTGDYQVWKDIRYTLACMKRPGGSDYSNRVTEATLKSEYEKSFIKLTRTGGLSKPAHKLLIEMDQSNVWAASELPAKVDRTLNFALIDTLAKGAPIPFNKEADAPYNVFSWTLSGGSYAFDLSAQNKWLTSAKYYDKNQPLASRVLHALPNNKVTLTLDGLNYKLTVDVSGIVSGGLALNRIHVVLALKKRDFLSGLSWGPTTIVAMRWRERNYSGKEGNATLHTMFHESGHFLGVAPKKLPNKSQSANPYYYDEGSLGVGKGPHCSYDKQNPTTAADLPATPKCIMYHEFRLTMNFCTNCSNSLRARDLSSPSVNGKTAGY